MAHTGTNKEGGMSEINCNNCAVSDFKESLCDRCDELKRLGRAEDIERLLIKAFSEVDSPAKSDCIERQAAIDAIVAWTVEDRPDVEMPTDLVGRIEALPSVQPERDTPIKPIETTDRAWGIPHRQAVCPKCDYYLGHVAFLGDYKGKRITYCETCGQAIDWEGWDFDE